MTRINAWNPHICGLEIILVWS